MMKTETKFPNALATGASPLRRVFSFVATKLFFGPGTTFSGAGCGKCRGGFKAQDNRHRIGRFLDEFSSLDFRIRQDSLLMVRCCLFDLLEQFKVLHTFKHAQNVT